MGSLTNKNGDLTNKNGDLTNKNGDLTNKKWWFNQQKWWFNQQKWWFNQQKWWFNQQKWWFNQQKMVMVLAIMVILPAKIAFLHVFYYQTWHCLPPTIWMVLFVSSTLPISTACWWTSRLHKAASWWRPSWVCPMVNAQKCYIYIYIHIFIHLNTVIIYSY